ncbi:MAG: hypothetical protein KAT25_06770 [Sulfuriflexus sp.]|nr:hypothetical protein [Sulfuriflexus sp.]
MNKRMTLIGSSLLLLISTASQAEDTVEIKNETMQQTQLQYRMQSMNEQDRNLYQKLNGNNKGNGDKNRYRKSDGSGSGEKKRYRKRESNSASSDYGSGYGSRSGSGSGGGKGRGH